MIKEIIFTFPSNTQSARDFFGHLLAIIREAPHVRLTDNSLVLAAAEPEKAYPATHFCLDDQVSFPGIRFDGDTDLTQLVAHIQPKRIDTTISSIRKHDSVGEYYESVIADTRSQRLSISEVHKRLQGHITRIDHTGFNIPTKSLSKEAWNTLTHAVARGCNLYNYPTGDDWPFIIPASKEEHDADIKLFPVGRKPKFELVYDAFSPTPSFQIDLETDLERSEIEHLFPAPYGVSFPDLADYFRTVYIYHEWTGLNIRFDMRFKSTDPANDWDTGKWLVEEGGRIAAGN